MQEYLNNEYKINDSSYKLISSTNNYLGGLSTYISVEDLYSKERGKTVYRNRNVNWVGKISLMYPSDYLFIYSYGVDDTCYNMQETCNNGSPNSNWLYKSGYNQWTLTPTSSYTNGAFIVASNGIFRSIFVNQDLFPRPVLYLLSKVKITSGDGTQSNPYKLSM